MNMRLDSREKSLLLLLGAIAFLLLGLRFLVYPAYKSQKVQWEELASVSQKMTNAMANVANAPRLDVNFRTKLSSVDNQTMALFPTLDNEDLNVWTVNLVQNAGLSLQSVSFGQPVSANIGETGISSANGSTNSTASSSSATPNYLLKAYADAYRGVAGKSASASASSQSSAKASASQTAGAKTPALLAVDESLTMTGSYAQATAFLDAVENCGKTALVTSFRIVPSVSGGYTVTAVLSCYGTEKLDDSDTTFTWSRPAPAGKSDVM